MQVAVAEQNPVDMRAAKECARQCQAGQIQTFVKSRPEYAETQRLIVIVPRQPFRQGRTFVAAQYVQFAQTRAG
jgi:hypothetical protein